MIRGSNPKMKTLQPLVFSVLFFVSCSNQDAPRSEIFSQIAEMSNAANDISRKISYDSYGRLINYVEIHLGETVSATYDYPSDNLIRIHTQQEIFGNNGARQIVREYEDELYLDNGRGSYCEGILSSNEVGSFFQKKYRHDFFYTTDNHLNVVKWTEWNKEGDDWVYEKPWTWENYYVLENDNLTEVEDFLGNSNSYYTYKYAYSTLSNVQNIIPIHYGRFQYYPLQLKGIFGLQPKNLIVGIENTTYNGTIYKIEYKYDIREDKVIGYSEICNGVSNDFSVV